jgi:hypothetical protein
VICTVWNHYRRIDGKAARSNAYRQSVPETSLVIVADGRKPSQLFMKNEERDVREPRSPFDQRSSVAFLKER